MRSLLPIPLLLAGVAAGCSVIPSVSVTPRYGRLDPNGDVFVSSNNASASSDVGALGLDGEYVFEPRADASWGPIDLMASGFDTSYSGRGVAQGQLDLGGVTINQGEQVDSNLDLKLASVLATWDLVPTSLLDLGLGIGVTYVDFDASVRSVGTGNTVGSAEKFAVPVLVARAGTKLGPIGVNLYASGLTGSYGGVDATLADIDLYAEYSFEDLLSFYAAIVLGYRTMVLDVSYTDQSSEIDANLGFSGIYFGLTAGI